MATAPATPLVSVDEYLNTSYEHDVEYVDGVLEERSLPTPSHSTLQAIISERLRAHRFDFNYAVLPECRVELVEGSRYRIPDVLLASLPVNSNDRVLKTVPLAVIEILSPEDRLPRQMTRFLEYWRKGVREVLLFDPEELVAFRYQERTIIQCDIEHIALPDGRKVPFSSVDLLNDLREELERQE